ncbi:MAG TPA: YtxH domain-containing protein [Candidatus Polarisedimenticolaceae bacterium]
MREIQHGSGKGMFWAALIGAGVGAGVALLYAPRAGKETREWLAERGRRMKDTTLSTLEQGKDAARRAAREIGGAAEDTAKVVNRPLPNGPASTILNR